jgi:hypothetical protein
MGFFPGNGDLIALTNAMKKAILASEIGLRFRPSLFLWGWWGIFSILVSYSLVYSLPPGWALMALVAYLLASAWQWTQWLATRWPWSVHALRVDVYGQMTLIDARGLTWSFKVKPSTVVHPLCLVLHLTDLQPVNNDMTFQADQTWYQRWLQPRRLLILSDQVDTHALQALRVWLKWGLRD